MINISGSSRIAPSFMTNLPRMSVVTFPTAPSALALRPQAHFAELLLHGRVGELHVLESEPAVQLQPIDHLRIPGGRSSAACIAIAPSITGFFALTASCRTSARRPRRSSRRA